MTEVTADRKSATCVAAVCLLAICEMRERKPTDRLVVSQPRFFSGMRALTIGTIQTAYPRGSRTLAIIWLK